MDLHHLSWWKVNFFLIELFIIVNIIFLDIIFLKNTKPKQAAQIVIQQTGKQQIASPLSSPAATKPTGEPTEILITPTPIVQTKYITVSNVKEYFVPFGSGQGSTGDWQNVPGLQAYIDSTNYPNIKRVVFEASVHIPTGNENASVRLFNATDQHPVWFSDVSLAGGDPQFLISQPISLDQGNKLYQVQMKTQLQYQAILDQARIHITIF